MIFLPDIEKSMDKLTALLCSIGESCFSMLCMLQNTNAREYTKLQQWCSAPAAVPVLHNHGLRTHNESFFIEIPSILLDCSDRLNKL